MKRWITGNALRRYFNLDFNEGAKFKNPKFSKKINGIYRFNLDELLKILNPDASVPMRYIYYEKDEELSNSINKCLKGKELEIKACKTFVCPNLTLLELKGRELGLSQEAIRKTKQMGIEFLKKTYHRPPYAYVKSIFPALLYMGGWLNDEVLSQKKCAEVFDYTSPICKKWFTIISAELQINKNCEHFECCYFGCSDFCPFEYEEDGWKRQQMLSSILNKSRYAKDEEEESQ